MLEVIQQYLAAAAEYLGLGSVIAGSAVGYVLTVMLELYFLPIASTPETRRRQKGLTFLFCWAASGAASALLWRALDPATPVQTRVIVSFVLGALSFLVYPVLAAYLTARFPAIGSAWARSKSDT